MLVAVACGADERPLVLEELARVGQPVPGAKDGETFASISKSAMQNDTGVIAVVCEAVRAGEKQPRAVLYTGGAGHFSRVASVGDVAPGLSDKPTLLSIELVGIDAAGRVLFNGKTVGRESGLESAAVWYGKGAFVGRLARSGEALLGETVNTVDVSAESLAPDGTIVMRARLRDRPREDVYYVGKPDALRRLPDANKPPPGSDEGVAFGEAVGPAAVNRHGRGVVVTRFRQGEALVDGMWLATSPERFRLIARAEPGLPGVPAGRVISSFGNRDGRGLALSDAGDVAFIGETLNVDAAKSGADEFVPGLWLFRAGRFRLVAELGSTPIGCDAGEQLVEIDAGSLRFTQGGALGFTGTIRSGDRRVAAGWIERDEKLSLLARADRANLRSVDWIGPLNDRGEFLLVGERAEPLGRALFRASVTQSPPATP